VRGGGVVREEFHMSETMMRFLSVNEWGVREWRGGK